MSSDPLRVCIFAENRHNVFSGGRYHSWHMAEALAARGHIAHYVTNNLPVFFDEFKGAPGHEDIKVHISKEFLTNLPSGPLDAVVVTPGRSDNPVFYRSARMLALTTGAQLTLINFEAGNWFNSLAPIKRELTDWDHWKRIVAAGGLVLSSAHESQKWARDFYNEFDDNRLDFDVWSPPINSTAADSVPWHEKEKRVTIISRLADPHKGFQTVLNALPDNIAGWTLAVMTGSSVEPAFETDLRAMAASKGINLEIIMRPSDREKFEELKRAKLMLFPSLFEGYGYPPIEALYCNTDVVSYDLPVVRETCGGLAMYAPHGDEDAFREMISKALDDPMLGKRDYHSQMHALANLIPAAERLEKVFAPYQDPKNRTTGQFEGGTVSKLDTEGRIDNRRSPMSPGLARQVRRIASLRDPSNWKPAGKRVANMAGRLLSQLDHKHGISGATVDQFGVISIRGWYLGPQRPTSIRVRVGDDIEADMETGLRRPDVAKKFPQYGEENPGFQILLRFVDRDLTNAPYKIIVDVKDKEVKVIEGILTSADKTNRKQVSRLNRVKRDIRGKSVVVMADFEDVRATTPNRVYLDNLLLGLRSVGMVTHLILQGNPADLLPYEKDFASVVDEVLIADVVKPAVSQEVFDEKNRVAGATLDTLASLQDRNVLVSAIAFGGKMAPALNGCGQGVSKVTAIWSPDEQDELGSWLSSSEIVVTPNETISAILQQFAPEAEHIQLPLLPEAYPTHVGLGPTESNRVLIPDCSFDGALESTLAFISGVTKILPTVRFDVLGELGDAVIDQILRDEQYSHLSGVVEALGSLFDTAEVFAEASVLALPFQPSEANDQSAQSWLRIEAYVIQGIAAERAIVAMPDVAQAFNTDHLTIVETNSESDSLAECAARLLTDANALEHSIEEGIAFRHARLHIGTATSSLKSVLKRPPFPAQRLLSEETDENVSVLFRSLLLNNSLLPANETVDLVMGQNVHMAKAALALLTERACTIRKIVSFRTDFQGLSINGISITGPAQVDGGSVVLACHDDEESSDFAGRCSRLGYDTIVSANTVPDIRDRREAEKLRSTASGEDVQIMCGLTDLASLPNFETGKSGLRIATDVFALREDARDMLEEFHVTACGNPVVAHKLPGLISAANPDGLVVTTDLDPTPTGATSSQILRVDTEDLPWFDPPALRNHQTYRVSKLNDRESLRLAIGLAVWAGAKSITVHGAATFVDPATGETSAERQTGWATMAERQDYLDFAADHGCKVEFRTVETLQEAEA